MSTSTERDQYLPSRSVLDQPLSSLSLALIQTVLTHLASLPRAAQRQDELDTYGPSLPSSYMLATSISDCETPFCILFLAFSLALVFILFIDLQSRILWLALSRRCQSQRCQPNVTMIMPSDTK